jgi:hypothetical protein
LASSTTSAATIGSGVDEYGNHYLSLGGPIVAGDPERLAAAIFEANARGYRLDALRLNSPGGAIWEAMAMAAMVRWVENMATVVQRDAKCVSACFGLFAAGHRKYVDPAPDGKQIGVHSVYELIRQEGAQAAFLKEAGDTTIQMVRILKMIGVPDSIIAKIVTTPPKGMSCLSIDDLWEPPREPPPHANWKVECPDASLPDESGYMEEILRFAWSFRSGFGSDKLLLNVAVRPNFLSNAFTRRRVLART